jgi:two-component system cell cycle sensor histidine kinase/response regulator CckA
MTPHSNSSPARPRVDFTTLSFSPEDVEAFFARHPTPSLLFDPATRQIIAANRAAETLYGWTSDELCAMSLEEMRPPNERASLEEELERLAHDDGTSWFETTHWRFDGTPIRVRVLSQPMRLDGRPIRRTMILDLTEEERAQAMFRGVAEQSLTGIYVIQDGRFVYLNPRFGEMFGHKVEDLLRHPDPLSYLSPDARAEADRRGAQRLAGKPESVRYQLRAARADGTPIDVEIYGSSLMLHGRAALLGTVLDVTDRARADAAMRESESRFRAAFDGAITGMSITAPNGQMVRVNAALCEMLGYTMDELTGRGFQTVTHPDDVAANLAARDALLAGEIPASRMDKRYLHKDGSIVWAEVNISLVRDAAGAPLYMVAQMHDLTARKRAEAALDESEAQLRHAQKMEAVGRLAGGVAHDFNNLLTVIGSNADLGAELAREGHVTPEEFAEIRAAVDRAAALTRQLLAFSRRQVLAPSPVSINEVVLDAERMLRRVIGEDVTLETRLDEHAGNVVADRGQLEQVLMNLVVNARDAMPNGGRVVIATQRDSAIQTSLSVRDEGIGMDAATQARVFEPFFTTKELGKGTGLGLSTVYGIAQQSGGDVSLRSSPGNGTTVTVTLPTTDAAGIRSMIDEAATAAATSEETGETILLVEDEVAVRTVSRRILQRLGYHVIEAANGADALFLWSMHHARVQLVLTDAVMPVMGGRELSERLREVGASVPILFMSGYADGERGGEIPPGAELIGKPFSAEVLGARVHHLLQAARTRQPALVTPAPSPPRG